VSLAARDLRSRLRVERFGVEAKAHEGESTDCLRNTPCPRPCSRPQRSSGNGKAIVGCGEGQRAAAGSVEQVFGSVSP